VHYQGLGLAPLPSYFHSGLRRFETCQAQFCPMPYKDLPICLQWGGCCSGTWRVDHDLDPVESILRLEHEGTRAGWVAVECKYPRRD
jgi:hypothetical protein